MPGTYINPAETSLYYLQTRYYDPETGKFISSDIYLSTGQGVLGYNSYCYCLNNPVILGDSNGTDAIWIQEESSVGGLGHTGLMVQDKNGDWWYFYWGPSFKLGEFNDARLLKLDVNGKDLTTTEGVKDVLKNNLNTHVKYNPDDKKWADSRKNVTYTSYYKGDYTNTYDYCNKLVNSNMGKAKPYRLLTDNCLQETIIAFTKSDKRFILLALDLNVIPNNFILKEKAYSIIFRAIQ